MIRSILLPLDGSQFAFGALPYATTIAKRAGARLELVTVTSDVAAPGTDSSEKRFPPDDSTYDLQEWSPEAVAARLRLEGLRVGTHVYVGDPAGEIVIAADVLGADLIVMATHGRAGLGRSLFGSVADGVLWRAGAPVLLVPPYTPPWTATELERGPRRLLVALDGTDLSEAALEPAAALAHAVGADVRLLRVAAPAHDDPVAGTLGRRTTRVLRTLEIPALLVRPTAVRIAAASRAGEARE
jgi:nucleotide-binding universal stress UspA family protein